MIDVIEIILITTSLLSFITTLVLFGCYKLRKSNCKNDEDPTVSVFLPFYNENEEHLVCALNKLNEQSYSSRIQVIVIDDGSTNNAIADVREWIANTKVNHDFQVVERKINGGRKGFALDHVLELGIATGKVYVVVDSDTYIEPNGIYELVTKLWSDDKYAAVCGYITPENHKDSFIGKLQHYEHISFYGAIRAAQDKLGCVPVLAGAFVAHRASAVKKLGGWSEWLVEDIAWCWKAISNGYRTGYAPKAKATTQCPTDAKGLFYQRRRWARGRVEAYNEAWKTHWVAGLCASPWFLLTAAQYIFPSSIVLFGFMVATGIWTPIVIGAANIFIYFLLVQSYIKDFDLSSDFSNRQVFKAPIYSALLESITWLPNLLGYADEILGKKKDWLTR
ncbi:glycosyltransferase family 2 protein [Vibrio cincinnatiensis]|jgi:cellulose synthase/poly-beta-1,6-N-acetylglucosamine synthase-like glycosyltransferase|uniref:glycosyltransferase family 2 protein n=1 Tax=Vibrio cincinnatiensis TaxID=675 RepID=UPI00130236C3|nr:glycosyltransferase family 2 protein [Vibrio cincinnatiensis]MCG3767044.1 glycosyltransferase family 2 protein [Vibrio cincinnatiensis]